MKVVILAGGMGTRLSEHTEFKPKPIIEIGGRPILWHIMKHYSHYGFKEFIIALGYKAEDIKDYFLKYHYLNSDISISLKSGKVAVRRGPASDEDWIVHLVDTGLETMTGGRLKRLAPWLEGERFMMTYGDGVSDIDLRKLLELHESHGKLATVTTVRPPARFGAVVFDGDRVAEFTEKPQVGEGWISAGYFVLEPRVLDYIEGDPTHWEREPLERLAREGQLYAYRHHTFWQCMDTQRDLRLLQKLWAESRAPWKVWE